MIVLRSTKRLSQLLRVRLSDSTPATTSALGDWYGNWMPTSIGPLVVLMNGPTRLAVLSKSLEPNALLNDARSHFERLLAMIGVPDDAAQREIARFDSLTFAKTVERTLIGSLNEICRMIAFDDEDGRLLGPRGLTLVEDRLAELVHLKLPETFPSHAVRARLGGVDPKLH